MSYNPYRIQRFITVKKKKNLSANIYPEPEKFNFHSHIFF